MTESAFRTLADVIDAELFPEIDLRLREGHHIDDIAIEHFAFLQDARALLEAFYDRFGCDLIRSPDGYFYLSPRGDRMGRRSLNAAEMLVGQTLCLLRLDPAVLRTMWKVPRARVIELLEQLVGADRLRYALEPRRKRRVQTVAEEEIRKDVDAAIRTLARLGFIDIEPDDQLRLRVPLLRFADPVAMETDKEAALSKLVSLGAPEDPDDEEEGEQS